MKVIKKRNALCLTGYRIYLLSLLFIQINVVDAIASTPAAKKYDVVVYGGGSAGFISAIQVAKMGKSVALIEPSGHLGGMNVEGLGGTDIDNHQEFQNSPAVGGLALEFYRRIAQAYRRQDAFDNMIKTREKRTDLWRFEPHIAQQVIDDWIASHRIDVFLNTRLDEHRGVEKKGKQIQRIRLSNQLTVEANIFVDASIEGDLLMMAGVSTTVGRESNETYQEIHNGIRKETSHAQFAVKVDPYQIPGRPESGLIATIQDETLGQAGAGDEHLQAYCFRMCLSKDPQNQIPFTKPTGYNRKDYEIYLRYLKAGGKLYTPVVSIPNGKTDLGAWHDLSHNLYGMNTGYPSGSYRFRQEILTTHRRFTQGLFYFLAFDSAVGELDPALQKEWASWGLAKDEFQDNEGWPRQFYVRDGRRMISDLILTEHHVRKENPLPIQQPVAVAYWPPDLHSVRRIVKDGYAYNEGFVFGGDWWRPFSIPYAALVPKITECTNLITPTCPSSSHVAYGAIRIEFTFMALGQAAGTAACMAISQHKNIQDISYTLLAQKLLKDGAILQLAKEEQ